MKTSYLLSAVVLCMTACNGSSSQRETQENNAETVQMEEVEVVQGSKILKGITFTDKTGNRGTEEVTYAYDDNKQLAEVKNSTHDISFDYQSDGSVKITDLDKRYDMYKPNKATIQPKRKQEQTYCRDVEIRMGDFNYQANIKTDLNHYLKSFGLITQHPSTSIWSGKNLTEWHNENEEGDVIKITYSEAKNPTNVNLLIHTNAAILSDLETNEYYSYPPNFIDHIFDYLLFCNEEFTHQSELLGTSMTAQVDDAQWDINIEYTFDKSKTPVAATYKVEIKDKENPQPEIHQYEVKYSYSE